MKKALTFALAIVLVFALTACAAQATAVDLEEEGEGLLRQILTYLAMTKDELIVTLGQDYTIEPAGPEGVCDGYFYEDLGMTFAFYPDEDTLELIACDSNFRMDGVGVGSLFSEIMDVFGDTEIIESWMELPEYTIYLLEYQWGEAVFSFISFDVDEPVHLLWIYQRP